MRQIYAELAHVAYLHKINMWKWKRRGSSKGS